MNVVLEVSFEVQEGILKFFMDYVLPPLTQIILTKIYIAVKWLDEDLLKLLHCSKAAHFTLIYCLSANLFV